MNLIVNQFKVHNMHIKEEMKSVNEFDTLRFEGERKMYHATGLGMLILVLVSSKVPSLECI